MWRSLPICTWFVVGLIHAWVASSLDSGWAARYERYLLGRSAGDHDAFRRLVKTVHDGVVLALAGEWIVSAGHQLEAAGASLLSLAKDAKRVIFDLAGLQRMDTAGAWFIDRAETELAAGGASVSYRGEQPKHDILLKEAGYHPPEKSTRVHPPTASRCSRR